MNGTPGDAAAEMRAERRVITAVFADIVGSTALGERFDPEDLRDIMGPAIDRMIARVEEFSGRVKDLAGDGMLALFGRTEDDGGEPERAVRAALAIAADLQEYAGDVARDWDVSGFGVRVGVETGMVALGPVGSGGHVEYAATGDAVVAAAGLQSHAEPFQVVAGPATFAAVGALFAWGEPRPVELKGRSEPVIARVVDGLAAV